MIGEMGGEWFQLWNVPHYWPVGVSVCVLVTTDGGENERPSLGGSGRVC